MPTGGAVHLGKVLPQAQGLAEPDVRVLPPSWHAGLGPQAVVDGFLRAMVNDDDDYAIARSYLTPTAAGQWRPSAGVTTYDDGSVHEVAAATGRGSRVTVSLSAPQVGYIDERGDYEPTPGTVRAAFVVARQQAGSWRIERLPDGVLMSVSDAQRSFRVADVYFLSRDRSRLVPEQVLLQSSPRGVATALVTALLNGPSRWLRPVVRSAVPAGTTLIGNVPVHDNGLADINLSASVRTASASDLRALSAQLVWTLHQVNSVASVRLLADGAPLPVPDVNPRQSVTSWGRFDPAPAPSTDAVLYVDNGRLRSTGPDAGIVARSDPGDVVAAARSADGRTLAVVQGPPGAERLLVGATGSTLLPRLRAQTFTPPTFDAVGDVVSVAAGAGARRVVGVSPAGGTVRYEVDQSLLAGPVEALRISPDGSRAAWVSGAGRLLVARMTGTVIDAARGVAPVLNQVLGVTWADADTLFVTASASGAARQVVQLDPLGYTLRPILTEGVRGAPVDVSAAPHTRLLVTTADGSVWIDAGTWRRLATGTAAVHSG
jgi:hypothetical protein